MPVALVLCITFGAPGATIAAAQSLPVGPSVGCPTTADASSVPFLRLIVNGACTDLSSLLTQSTPGIWNVATTVNLDAATVDLTAQFKRDPFITFSASTKNLVPGDVTYAFVFGTPVVPGLYTSASSSGGLTLSPGALQNATVSPSDIHPTYIAGLGTQGADATNLGVDLGTMPCTATGTATTTCNLGMNSATFAPTFFDNLDAVLAFKQSDLSSAAGFSGRIDLTAPGTPPTTTTPEPSALALLAPGVVALGGMWRRKRRGC